MGNSGRGEKPPKTIIPCLIQGKPGKKTQDLFKVAQDNFGSRGQRVTVPVCAGVKQKFMAC